LNLLSSYFWVLETQLAKNPSSYLWSTSLRRLICVNVLSDAERASEWYWKQVDSFCILIWQLHVSLSRHHQLFLIWKACANNSRRVNFNRNFNSKNTDFSITLQPSSFSYVISVANEHSITSLFRTEASSPIHLCNHHRILSLI
jgi:hypothetical protein